MPKTQYLVSKEFLLLRICFQDPFLRNFLRHLPFRTKPTPNDAYSELCYLKILLLRI